MKRSAKPSFDTPFTSHKEGSDENLHFEELGVLAKLTVLVQHLAGDTLTPSKLEQLRDGQPLQVLHRVLRLLEAIEAGFRGLLKDRLDFLII